MLGGENCLVLTLLKNRAPGVVRFERTDIGSLVVTNSLVSPDWEEHAQMICPTADSAQFARIRNSSLLDSAECFVQFWEAIPPREW